MGSKDYLSTLHTTNRRDKLPLVESYPHQQHLDLLIAGLQFCDPVYTGGHYVRDDSSGVHFSRSRRGSAVARLWWPVVRGHHWGNGETHGAVLWVVGGYNTGNDPTDGYHWTCFI